MTTEAKMKGERFMMKKVAALVGAAMMGLVLLAGCGATQELPEKENTATADMPEPAIDTNWEENESIYTALEADAQADADATTADKVRAKVDDYVAIIEDNVPAMESAVEKGKINDKALSAASAIWSAAHTLEVIGAKDAEGEGVGEYISDLAHDAKNIVRCLYYGQKANLDVAQSEVTENYLCIKSFTDEEWATFEGLF